ncbi:hypothetical protein [Spiroplasma turonicum]|uniref:Transmembrane protein n=1 Tax=Spiroplasma turonicum TaxID=216946 RepID=A0A0K1P7G5_9MOLU|nr:hypothetical protein [Spiroplasma turonicum]AKU80124.1 hypothetical protein STURON_00878 [Spiroplasma turonicum]ALX71124.1 hypothetical protein STURO_v1c08730 [Spiroplasma turonicum]
MGFKKGVIVNYNQKNYLIEEVIHKQLSDRQLTFLRIKDLLNQEVLTVESSSVKSIVVNKRTNDFDKSDTEYINSLFDFKNNKDKKETFFDITNDEQVYSNDTLLNDNGIYNENFSTKDLENYNLNGNKIVESFFTEKTQPIYKPRRNNSDFSSSMNSKFVDQTFSNLKTSELNNENNELQSNISSLKTINVIDNNEKVQEFVKNEEIDQDENLKLDGKYINYNNSSNHVQSFENTFNEYENLLNTSNQNNVFKSTNNSEPNLNSVVSLTEDLNQLNNHLLNNPQVNQPSKDINTSFNNYISNDNIEANSFKDLNTSKSSIEASNYENIDNLTETNLFGTNKLNDIINKHEQIINDYKNNEYNETNTIYGLGSNFNKAVLKASTAYKKFKTMSIWLVVIMVFTLITPLSILTTKLTLLFLENEEFSTSYFKLFELQSMIYIDISMIASIIVLLIIFISYLIAYIIFCMKTQFKKVAYQNYVIDSKLKIIDSIQEFNSETSTFLIKVHSDIKKIKQRLKKQNQSNLSSIKNNSQQSKFSH